MPTYKSDFNLYLYYLFSAANSKTLQCVSCAQNFSTPWALLQHAQTSHSLNIYQQNSTEVFGSNAGTPVPQLSSNESDNSIIGPNYSNTSTNVVPVCNNINNQGENHQGLCLQQMLCEVIAKTNTCNSECNDNEIETCSVDSTTIQNPTPCNITEDLSNPNDSSNHGTHCTSNTIHQLAFGQCSQQHQSTLQSTDYGHCHVVPTVQHTWQCAPTPSCPPTHNHNALVSTSTNQINNQTQSNTNSSTQSVHHMLHHCPVTVSHHHNHYGTATTALHQCPPVTTTNCTSNPLHIHAHTEPVKSCAATDTCSSQSQAVIAQIMANLMHDSEHLCNASCDNNSGSCTVGKDIKSYGKDIKSYGNGTKSYGKDIKSYGKDVKSFGKDIKSIGKDIKYINNEVENLQSDVLLDHNGLEVQEMETIDMVQRESMNHDIEDVPRKLTLDKEVDMLTGDKTVPACKQACVAARQQASCCSGRGCCRGGNCCKRGFKGKECEGVCNNRSKKNGQCNCCNENCGVTMMPGTHEKLRKCCIGVVPKKRKRHMETKHCKLKKTKDHKAQRRTKKAMSSSSSLASDEEEVVVVETAAAPTEYYDENGEDRKLSNTWGDWDRMINTSDLNVMSYKNDRKHLEEQTTINYAKFSGVKEYMEFTGREKKNSNPIYLYIF